MAEDDIALGHQASFLQFRAEIAAVRVGDHLTGVVAGPQGLPDQLVEPEAVRAGHLEGAVGGRAHCGTGYRIGDVLGRDRLEQHRRNADGLPVSGGVRMPPRDSKNCVACTIV